MAKSKLIKDTTRAEREEIIKLALAGCGNGSCDNCGSCSLGLATHTAPTSPTLTARWKSPTST